MFFNKSNGKEEEQGQKGIVKGGHQDPEVIAIRTTLHGLTGKAAGLSDSVQQGPTT